ncbi:hypothetical protein GIB67_013511 [Kingdonia uniflora]|uniref:Exosome RNA helicase MTR4-like beta-barrel domain-containing protein n=1 Tax=Kingdonia uniflora TaxID=39325 RepID=A0A7J7KUX5_9MAGN|nr:hypothetical protein GIB67_013511 [Kingdonia uniflora]
MHVVPVQLPLILALSKMRINVTTDLRPMEARQSILVAVQELATRFLQGFPKLNPIKVLGKLKAQEDLDVVLEQNSPVTPNSESEPKQQSNLVWICVHEVAVLARYVSSKDESIHGTLSNPVFDGTEAESYPFNLGPFQQVSVACLKRNVSVLVKVHTSAGKTAMAEYAIVMAF